MEKGNTKELESPEDNVTLGSSLVKNRSNVLKSRKMEEVVLLKGKKTYCAPSGHVHWKTVESRPSVSNFEDNDNCST